jgi:flagellar hook-basal body complex protein FliE
MVEFNPSVSGLQGIGGQMPAAGKAAPVQGEGFAKAVGKYLDQVDKQSQASDASVADLLSGKNQDINSVVMAAAKADASFKLLVGVRNKLIEAYKQTMNMQV